MALAPANITELKQLAKDWITKFPNVKASEIHHCRRLTDEGARAAFSISTRSSTLKRKDIDPMPCHWCGAWTFAWCEACSLELGPPTALCSECDACHLICRGCMGKGLCWETSRANHLQRHGNDIIEINGYEDENGDFIPIRPCLAIPGSELGVAPDGAISMEDLSKRILSELKEREGQ